MNLEHFNHNHTKIVEAPVARQLTDMALPVVMGLVSIMLFNVVDTFWVAQLGTAELAAISFTFPVTFLLISVALGLGTGTASVLSKILGAKDLTEVKHLTTSALFVSLHIVGAIALIGFLTIRPLFSLIGAEGQILNLVYEYMSVWYPSTVLLMLPVVSNSAMRATGDTLRPGIIMGLASLTNALLDPLLIFGWGPVPAFGIRGAALSTMISWLAALVTALYFLIHRYGMVEFRPPAPSDFLRSARRVLRIAIPAMATNILNPIATAVVMALAANHGHEAVAALGVGVRMEPLALIAIVSLSSVLTPFVGQNWGAGKNSRVREAFHKGVKFTLCWGIAICVLLLLCSPLIGMLFTNNATVYRLILSYFWIVPISYCFQGILMIATAVFNALHHPLRATTLNLIRLFLLLTPLCLIFSAYLGIRGIFVGISLSNLLIGALAFLWVERSFREKFPELTGDTI